MLLPTARISVKPKVGKERPSEVLTFLSATLAAWFTVEAFVKLERFTTADEKLRFGSVERCGTPIVAEGTEGGAILPTRRERPVSLRSLRNWSQSPGNAAAG
jgi:hypothetical protein